MDRLSATNPDETIFRALFEQIADGMLLFADGVIADCNPAASIALGYSSRAALVGRHLADFSPERQLDGQDSRERERALMAAAQRDSNIRSEWLYRRADGDGLPVELLLTTLPEDSAYDVCVLWRDISKRRQAEMELHLAQETLEKRVEERTRQIERQQQVAEGLREILAILNSNRTMEEILNHIVRQTASLLGNDAGAVYLIQGNMLRVQASLGLEADLLSDMIISDENNPIPHAVSGRRPIVVSNTLARQKRAKTPEQIYVLPERLAERYHALLAVPLVVKEIVYGAITLYYREIRVFSNEEIALAMAFGNQAALAIENANLRAEAEQAAAAAERDRIARDLHDSVTQTLFSATLIAQVLPRLWNLDRQEGQRQLEELRLLTRGALAEMRTLLLELRPAALAKAPLSESLRHLVDAAVGRAGIPIKLTLKGDTLLSPDVKVPFYRIAQEALNNIVKHAEASEAELVLVREPGLAALHVSDNGLGFALDDVRYAHLGMSIMAERAQTIGATLDIDSQPGAGTRVSAVWRGTRS